MPSKNKFSSMFYFDRPLINIRPARKEMINSTMIGQQQMSRDNPHYYKPLPLPLEDALHFVKKYGPYAQKRKSSVQLRSPPEKCIPRQRPLCKKSTHC